MERYKHYLTICGPAPSERLGVIALRSSDAILQKNRKLIKENLKALSAFFEEYSELFEWEVPAAGTTGFPRHKSNQDTETFCQELLEKSDVLLLPPSMYKSDLAAPFTDRFRIGYGRKNLPECLDAFRGFLSSR